MIAQGQTDMPPARARHAPALRGLNKKESICSECVCEAGRVGVAEAADGRGATVQWRPAQFLR